MDRCALARQGKEMLGMLMIGDGALTLLDPDRHMRLWQGWSSTIDRWMGVFLQRPGLTRALGAVELAVGLVLASRQTPAQPPRHLPEVPIGAKTFVIEEEEVVEEIGY